MMRDDNLLTIALVFIPLSLAAFGGGMSVISGVQHQAVDVHAWLTEREFLNFFAIARAAPGPGSMLTTLIGWHVAGWSGALVATAAMFLPSSLLCAALAFFWRRHREKAWLKLLEKSLVPIGVGFLLAGVLTLTSIAEETPAAIVIGILSAAACLARPQTNPLLILGAGAVINVIAYLVMP